MSLRTFVLICCVSATLGLKPKSAFKETPEAINILTKVIQARAACLTPELNTRRKSGQLRKTDKIYQEFVYCNYEKAKLLEEDGRLNLDVMLPLLIEEKRGHMIECNKKVGKDKYETTYLIHNCAMEDASIQAAVMDRVKRKRN